jgi:hypothetical protein
MLFSLRQLAGAIGDFLKTKRRLLKDIADVHVVLHMCRWFAG